MSLWRKLIGRKDTDDSINFIGKPNDNAHDASKYAIVDVEVGWKDHKIHDIGALRYDDAIYHGASVTELVGFLNDVDYICGHNIIHHDAKYLFGDKQPNWILVDTLYMSPLLFPDDKVRELVSNSYRLVAQKYR